jgi:uncharacterized protein YndB with AHSA1/START domain
MERIEHTIDIEAAPDMVYSAVTTQDGLRGWWTRQAEAAPTEGHVNEFRFSSGDYNAMRVVALEPDGRVEWECVEGSPEWIGTRVVFRIEGAEGGTRLTFSHADWRADTPFFRMCRKAWEWYMASLKQYCETGMGTPS